MICRMIKLAMYAGALGCGALIAWGVNRPTVEGSGVTATEERDIGDVSEVVLSGSGDVRIVPGDFPSVKVTADDNILQHISTETHGRKLQLQTTSSVSVRPKSKITYVVTLPQLEALTLSGAGNATAEKFVGDDLTVKVSGAGTATLRHLTYKSLTVELSGAGKALATGSAVRSKLKLSGAGGIDASELRTSSTEVQVSGAGQASVWATVDLKARVSGAGGVKYKGSPNVDQKVSGAGRVRPMD